MANETREHPSRSSTSVDKPCFTKNSELLNTPALVKDLSKVNDFLELTNQEKIQKITQKYLVPKKALEEAIDFSLSNSRKIMNKQYITIADFTRPSKEKRLFIIDMYTGEVMKDYVAHGGGIHDKDSKPPFQNAKESWSDTNFDDIPDRCFHSKKFLKNKYARHKYQNLTRAGFMLFKESYRSPHYSYYGSNHREHTAIEIEEVGTNKRELKDNHVVLHEWDKFSKDKSYMSKGCPTIPVGSMKKYIKKLRGGSLYYSYMPKCYKYKGKSSK